MSQRHGGKMQKLGGGDGQLSVDAMVAESVQVDWRRSIRNDFLLGGFLLVAAVALGILIIATEVAITRQPGQSHGGLSYFFLISVVVMAFRHLARGYRLLRNKPQ